MTSYDKRLNQFMSLFIVGLTLLIFAAFLIPEWFAFAHLKPFTWQNSWDKCTYLSYQGVLALRNRPGTYLLWLVGWLQEHGLAGSVQAVLFDTLLPALSLYCAYRTFVLLKQDRTTALAYATIILFASVLFNFCNPHLARHVTQTTHFPFFLVGWETYPSILRAPNPQFSYFLIALSVYLFFRCKKTFFLLLPIPFLYYFVFVPYLYLLVVCFMLFKTKRIHSTLDVVILNSLVFLLLSGLVWGLFAFFISPTDTVRDPGVFQLGRHMHFNLVGCVGMILYLLLHLFRVFNHHQRLNHLFLSCVLGSFAITDLQLITNFSLDLKNVQDYGNSIIGGLILVMALHAISPTQQRLALRRLGSCVVLGFIAKYTLLSQGFDFHTYRFTLHLGPSISQAQWQHLKKDPLHAIVLDETLSEFLPFSTPKLLAPVFSYQYRYPFFENSCHLNRDLAQRAAMFVKQACDSQTMDCVALQKRIDDYFDGLKNHPIVQNGPSTYCHERDYAGNHFYFIQPTYDQAVMTFP